MKNRVCACLAVFFAISFLSVAQNVRISEFMANNVRELADEDGQFPDWLEIQNSGPTAVNLAGWHLTDNPAALTKWTFPSVSLGAGNFLVVFASGKDRTNNPARLHTSFRLNADGGYLALVRPDGSSIVSAFTYPAMKEDVSFGNAEQQFTTSLLAGSAPQILVPANAGDLPANWNQLAYVPDSRWTNGLAPPSVGFDTNTAVGAPVNVALSGTAVQSTTLNASYPAANAINNNLGDFSHTATADSSPFWQVTLTNQMAIFSVVLFNRTSCCGSRLRDITIEVLSTNGADFVTNYSSTLLNPENAGFAYPNGPSYLSNNLVSITGGPVNGNVVRVRRTSDPDLSGTGGQGNADEANVLSLGEVVVNASAAPGLRPFFRNDLQAQMFGHNASSFVRLPFNSTDVPDSLSLTVRNDDGFVAYLNGAEILRRNAPGTLAWDSAATVDRNFASAITQETIDISTAIPLLVSGANFLAVQVLNFSADNGDLLFDPTLTATRSMLTTNVFLSDATPGSANIADWYLDEVSDTHFSVDRGFFDTPFSLSITSGTPDAVIYYSFNCDEPGPSKGFVYTGPIAITNTTIVRARAFKTNWKPSNVDTHSYLFLADVIRQAPTGAAPQYFPASWGRNRVNYGMDPLVVARYTLDEWKEALTQIPTMSIVTEMGNLFDPTTGIYANADGHGEDWERASSLELLDPMNAAAPGRFQENCGLRIRGGASRDASFVKHSLRVFFRREYGAGKLHYPLFEDDGAQEFETFDLRTSQNYAWSRETSFSTGQHDTMVREVFCRQTLGDMGQPYRRSRYYHLYVNGQYWGVYETDERPEASYGETYFGGSKTNYDVVKCANHIGNFVTEATDGNLIAFSNLWTMCRAMVTNASTANYLKIIGRNPDGSRNPALPVLLDVDNLIDYMLEIFYSGDGDATLSSFLANNMPNNWFGMRDRTNPDVGFRFFNSDCEHTLGSPNSQVDRTGPFGGSNEGNFTYANPQWMHEELMRNAEYRILFADHVQKHFFGTGALTPQAGTNRFMRKAVQIDKAMRAYEARWGDANTSGTRYSITNWANMVSNIVATWFPTRTSLVLDQLRADALYPSNGPAMFSQFGGEVPAGFNLELAHTNASGAIYFTIDGSDPRAVGGAVAASAQAYSSPITINSPIQVRTRVLIGTNWSAIVEYFFYPPQDFGKLLITEIMYHPPAVGLIDGDEYEFLELKNTGTAALNLSGLRFTAGITFSFTNGTTLGPGQFLVLVRNPARFAEKYPGVAYHGIYSGRLDNGGETVTLSHPLGTKVLSVTYDDSVPWPLTPDGSGFSLVPKKPDSNPDPDSAQNWRASALAGGSPGADDPFPSVPTVLVNEVLSHSETGVDFVELFNPNGNPVDIGGWFLTDDADVPMKYRIADGTSIAGLSYLVFDESQFNTMPGTNNSFSFNSHGDDVYLFSGDANTNLTGYSHGFAFGAAPNGGTFGRYLISTFEEQFPLQIQATPGQPNSGPRIGPIVINEIQYHPDTGNDEFVELKNISSNSVALYDPAYPTNTWKLSGAGYTFPQGVVLAGGQKLLLVGIDPSAFRSKYSIPAAIQIFGPWTGVLQDSGERLEFQRPDVPDTNGVFYITVDEVRYNDRAPWPAAADGSGPSLQRRVSAAYGNDPANWTAAIPTPGEEWPGGSSPSIVTNPQSQSVVVGQTASFTVSASGPAPLNYQWRFNGEDISGANSSNLILNAVTPAKAGNYSVIVFNSSGSAASAIAILTVRMPPQITTAPANQLVRPGNTASFTVVATGNGFLRYQWQFNGVNRAGATNATLAVSNAQFADEGNYTVIVTDSIGSISSAPVRLIILVDPIIIQHPISQTVVAGGNVTISATVTNTATLPIGYRLRRNSVTLNDTFIERFDRTGFYTITNVQLPFTNYAIIATNASKPSGNLSTSAFLTILTDSDGDGIPDLWEAQYGFDTNNAANRNADPDGDLMSNWQEYIAGTDPTNASSYLRADLSLTGTSASLQFFAVSNKTYTLQYNDGLAAQPWRKLADIAPRTTNRVATVTDPAANPSRYYRIATPQQP